MRFARLLRLAGLPIALSLAVSAHAATLSVSVRNVSNTTGFIVAALCDKETFLKRCAAVDRHAASPGAVILKFLDVVPGR